MLNAAALFIASLALLILAARFFTSAAERIGLALGMSPFVVGVFIVAIGTSLPELVASLLAVKAGTSEIVSGNVLGANASNLLLLLGVVSVVSRGRIALGEHYLFIDLNFMLGAMLLLAASMVDGHVGTLEGLLLLSAYVIYTVYLVREGRTDSADAAQADALPTASRRMALDVAILAIAGVAIYFGGEMTVDALRDIAAGLAIPPAIAAITILSIGTTLPELAVSVTAALKGQGALAVGNILGSTIFNALAVAGAARPAFAAEFRAALRRRGEPAVLLADAGQTGVEVGGAAVPRALRAVHRRNRRCSRNRELKGSALAVAARSGRTFGQRQAHPRGLAFTGRHHRQADEPLALDEYRRRRLALLPGHLQILSLRGDGTVETPHCDRLSDVLPA